MNPEKLFHNPVEIFSHRRKKKNADNLKCRGLMDGIAAVDGVKMKGRGSHKRLIDYICNNYNIEESKRVFLQDLRSYRNRISYEGFYIEADYLTRNESRLHNTISQLRDILNEKLQS